jgi:hypothetical protein
MALTLSENQTETNEQVQLRFRFRYLQCSNLGSYALGIIGVKSQGKQEVPSHLKTEPAACHARCNLQQIWHYTFIHASNALLGDNTSNCIEYRFVLVSHPRHGINLETSAKNVTNVISRL